MSSNLLKNIYLGFFGIFLFPLMSGILMYSVSKSYYKHLPFQYDAN